MSDRMNKKTNSKVVSFLGWPIILLLVSVFIIESFNFFSISTLEECNEIELAEDGEEFEKEEKQISGISEGLTLHLTGANFRLNVKSFDCGRL